MTVDRSETNVESVLLALNHISKGRMVMDWNEVTSGTNPYVVTKTSNIPGKSVIEIPGLVFGDKRQRVSRIGVGMTLTESMIELASALRLDVLVVHHPVAEAANSGGVPFADYLPLYGLSLIEMHEAFHGLHPGLTFLHGHRKLKTDTAFGGVPGNVLHKGVAFDDVRTAGGPREFLLVLRGESAAATALAGPRLERAVGVIYVPQTERQSHYFTARLARQFDVVIYVDSSTAVQPLAR